MTGIETLAVFLAEDLNVSAATRANVQAHLTDTVGAWVAGAAIPEGRALLAFRSGDGIDVGTPSALARLSEIDNIVMNAATTPGGIIIPAAITLAVAQKVDGKALSDAILAGVEAMVRLGRAIDGPNVIYRGIWPTYFGAPFGVAAAASRLLGLDAKQTAHALALALTFAAPGVGHHNATTTSRWFAVAQAARGGLVAARAAQAGFTSDLHLMESGFLTGTFGVTPDLKKFAGGLGQSFAIDEASFKPWCAARQTMAATQGLKEILSDGVTTTQIVSVEATVPPPYLKMTNHGVVPGDRASFLTSLPYQLAIAACEPEAEFDIAQTPASVPADVQAFMAKVKVAADEALLAHYPATWPGRIVVRTDDRTYERLVLAVPGEATDPLSEADREAKFRRFVSQAAGAQATDKLFEACAGASSGPDGVANLVRQIHSLYPKPLARD